MAACPAGAIAQQPARPESADRVVAAYDFEEPTNPFEVPADFFRAQSDPTNSIERPGYPVFNQAAFDDAHAYDGERSVRLPIVRGSVSLRLRPGAVPIFADADYRVSVHVRGEGIEHARFRLRARLLDQVGEPIEGAEWTSRPVLPVDEWVRTGIAIPGGGRPSAAFLQIDAEVVQPPLYRQPTLDRHQVWPEDFGASAWIDGLVVSQLPRVVLRPSETTGLYIVPEAPKLELTVRDLAGDRLAVTLVTRDHRGRIVDRQTSPIRSSRVPTVWTPAIPMLGWYETTALLTSDGQILTSAACSFLMLPARAASGSDAEGGYDLPDRGRFALATGTDDPAVIGLLPRMGDRLATYGVRVDAWHPDLTPGRLPGLVAALGSMLRDTEHAWSRPAAALSTVPASLREALIVDPDGITETLLHGPDVWGGLLEHTLERVGEIARRWRIGPITGVPPRELQDTSAFARIRDELAMLVPGPVIELAWPAVFSFAGIGGFEDVRGLAVHLPAGSGSRHVGGVVRRFAANAGEHDQRLTFSFGSAEAGAFAGSGAAGELAKRMIEAEAGVNEAGTVVPLGYELADPWSVTDRDGVVLPHPTLGVWRATIDRLRGRRITADLGFVPGTRVYLLTPNDDTSKLGGALVAWNESANPDEALIELNLGDRPVTVIDIWGNRSPPVEPVREPLGDGKPIIVHRIPLGQDPVFVEGIDVELTRFTASIRLDEPVLQATPGPHERDILLTNPWPVAIDGDIILLEPAERLENGRATGWDITPRVRRFSAAPGESVRIPVSISFARVEQSGRKPVVIDVALSSGPLQDRVRASSVLDIVLDGIDVDLRPVVAPGSDDLALEVYIANATTETLDLSVLTAARGFPRQSASISQIPPGASVVRRFLFRGGAATLSGQAIYVGVEDPSRNGRLNKTVTID